MDTDAKTGLNAQKSVTKKATGNFVQNKITNIVKPKTCIWPRFNKCWRNIGERPEQIEEILNELRRQV